MRIDIRKSTWLVGAIALVAQLTAQASGVSLGDLIDSVARDGRDGQLPPHLSLVLGIGDGTAPVPVKQAVLRKGSEVRVLNVSVANHDDVVIFRTDEKRQITRAYLVSRTGTLRDAVFYAAGEQPQRAPASEAGAAAAAEIKFWTGLRDSPAPTH